MQKVKHHKRQIFNGGKRKSVTLQVDSKLPANSLKLARAVLGQIHGVAFKPVKSHAILF